MNNAELKKSLISPPGETIQEHIDEIGMSQAELAKRLGRSIPKLNELIKGKAPITKETASKLEYVLGIPISFWLNLERLYQEEQLEIKRLEELEKYKVWLNSFPIKKMKELGILPNTIDKRTLVDSLLKYFRVASPMQWLAIYEGSSLAFKIELRHTAEPQAISVWLRLGELQAEKLKVAHFDPKVFRNNLHKLKQISFEHSDTWMEDLQTVCAAYGIALVYTPCIAKAPIYGATRWIKNNSMPLIQLTDRRKDYSSFWFTFYHEIAHILLHGKKDIFINGLDSIEPDLAKENEADKFAERMLLSEKERNELFQNTEVSINFILNYSKKFKSHPSIIAGQIERKYKLYGNSILNRLKTKVKFQKSGL